MAGEIKCPQCGHEFEPTDSIREELRTQMNQWKKEQQEQFENRILLEKKKLQDETEKLLRKSIAADFENKLRLLEENAKSNEEKLKTAREKETDFLRKEQSLKSREEELELNIQRKLSEEREKLSEELRKLEEKKVAQREQEYQMKFREMEKQLEDQKKLAEEMRRKAEQGSTQLQGEVQELELEKILQDQFPDDLVEEVGKGVEGADCILVVRNNRGMECGRIIFESKRTKGWQNAWVEKLRSDKRKTQAEFAILVSQVYPRGMECFGEREGVWIASFREVIHLTRALRNALIGIHDVKQSEENKGEKMQMLYNYLTGIEFRQQIEAIVEGFESMRNSITREKIQMEKIWKEREKQLEKVLFSTAGMYGSVKGIAGASVKDIPLLDLGEEDGEEGLAG